jgi:hypothetical protein
MNNPLENWQSAARDLTTIARRVTAPIEGRRLHPSVFDGSPSVTVDDCMRVAVLFDLHGSARRLTRSHIENPQVRVTVPDKAQSWLSLFLRPNCCLPKMRSRTRTFEVAATLDQYMLGRLLLNRSLFHRDLSLYLIRRALVLVGSHEELSAACGIPNDSLPYGSLDSLPK